MRALVALFLIGTVASAGDGDRETLRRVASREREFWHEYPRRFRAAVRRYFRPLREDGSSRYVATDSDLEGIRLLYEAYESIEKERGSALVGLAASGDVKTLVLQLRATMRQVARVEADLRKPPVQTAGGLLDQRPAVVRHGLAARERALVEAIAALPDAESALASSIRNLGTRERIVVIDALGVRRRSAGRPLIEPYLFSRIPAERIAAIEALVRYGASARNTLAARLPHTAGAVRRALFDSIDTTDPGWVAPLVEALESARGFERARVLGLLRAITGASFDDDVVLWRVWYAKHRGEIARGRFAPAGAGARPRPLESTVEFCGIPTASRRIAFVLDDAWGLALPAPRTRAGDRHWLRWQPRLEDRVTRSTRFQRGMAKRLDRVMAALPENVKASVLPIGGNQRRRFGFKAQDPHAAILGAMRDRSVDTVFLVYTGHVRATRFLMPEALVADIERRNRFRRLVVHSIRICNCGPESAWLMEALAKRTRGKSAWLKTP